jgi:hypothetical protein
MLFGGTTNTSPLYAFKKGKKPKLTLFNVSIKERQEAFVLHFPMVIFFSKNITRSKKEKLRARRDSAIWAVK